MCVDGSLVYDLSPRAHRLEYTYIKVIVLLFLKKSLRQKMGGTFSDPVPPLINQGYICFVLRSFDKLRVLHGNMHHFYPV